MPPPPSPHDAKPAEFEALPKTLRAAHPTPAPTPLLPMPRPQDASPAELEAFPIPLTATHPISTLTFEEADPQESLPPELVASPRPLTEMQLTLRVQPPPPEAFPFTLTASVVAQASLFNLTLAVWPHPCAAAGRLKAGPMTKPATRAADTR